MKVYVDANPREIVVVAGDKTWYYNTPEEMSSDVAEHLAILKALELEIPEITLILSDNLTAVRHLKHKNNIRNVQIREIVLKIWQLKGDVQIQHVPRRFNKAGKVIERKNRTHKHKKLEDLMYHNIVGIDKGEKHTTIILDCGHHLTFPTKRFTIKRVDKNESKQ